MQKLGTWLLPVIGVLALLLFTPIGGIVNFIGSGVATLGAFALAGWAVLDLFSFRDYGDAHHWKVIGLKIAGMVGLVLFAAALGAVLPPPPSSNNGYCIETRSNPVC